MKTLSGRLEMSHGEPGKGVSARVTQPVVEAYRQPCGRQLRSGMRREDAGSPPGRQLDRCLGRHKRMGFDPGQWPRGRNSRYLRDAKKVEMTGVASAYRGT